MEENPGVYKLMSALNEYCFHTNEADYNCNGCPFQNETPCPLNEFYVKLQKHLYKKRS